MKVLYGFGNTFIDVTSKCQAGDKTIVPNLDVARAGLFGDPMVGVVKLVRIEYDDGSTRDYGEECQLTFYCDAEEGTWKVRETEVPVDPRETLRRLQSKLSFDHGSLEDEYTEQLMSVMYVPKDACVLEIGGNVGRNSCILASILEDGGAKMVVLESDPESARKLDDNRERNGFNFHIESAALSKRPLVQRQWETKEASPGLGAEWTPVKTITWTELKKKYPMNFDTLILDCEGAFYFILKDEPSILDGIKLVQIENDFANIEEKEFCDVELIKRGFECVLQVPGGNWSACKDRFYEVWRRDY